MSKPTSIAKKQVIWQDRLARHAASDRSVHAFCRSESISTASFYLWRKRLSAIAVDFPSDPRESTPQQSSTFIDLGAMSEITPDTTQRTGVNQSASRVGTGIELRIALGNDIVLTIVRH